MEIYNKYPIEIEFTSYCWLKCNYCINWEIQNKLYLDIDNYNLFLDYVYNNIDNILYVNFSWIWDLFLHPKINLFLIMFIKKFKWTNLNVLISTKWITLNNINISILSKFSINNINLNISIGIFSFNEKLHDNFTNVKWSFNKTIKCIYMLKNKGINFSLELLISKYSINTINSFKRFINNNNIEWILHNVHDFNWRIDISNESSYNGKDYCNFSDLHDFESNFYKNFSKCKFIPILSCTWFFYICSISSHSKNWLIKRIEDIIVEYNNYIDFVIHTKSLIWTNCNNCSLNK